MPSSTGLDTYTTHALANGILRSTSIRKRKQRKSSTPKVGPESRSKAKYGANKTNLFKKRANPGYTGTKLRAAVAKSDNDVTGY